MKVIISEKEVIEVLEKRLIQLQIEVNRTEKALSILKGTAYRNIAEGPVVSTKSEPHQREVEIPDKYDSQAKWEAKVLFALSKTKEAYKEDIVKQLNDLEPNTDTKKLDMTVAVKLSNLLKANIISSEKVGRRVRYKL